MDYLSYTITERGAFKIVENRPSNIKNVEKAFLVLASTEKQDKTNPEDASIKVVEEVAKLGRRLKVKTIVLHLSANLFEELSDPEVTMKILKLTEEGLVQYGFEVTTIPFGWFNTLELWGRSSPIPRFQAMFQ